MPESADRLDDLPEDFWRTLDDGLAEIGLELSERSRAAIDSHVRLLLAWNASINLTALRTPEQIARNHVLDSLIAVAPLRKLARGKVGRILDLGSGGGFPGLPIAVVAPARKAILVDSVGKKARFLAVAAAAARNALAAGDASPPGDVARPRQATAAGDARARGAATGRGAATAPGEATAPEIVAAAERAEDLAQDPGHREVADLVLARAVGSVSEVAELGLPLVRVRGQVVMWKRDAGDESLGTELADARRISQACGGSDPRIIRLDAAERIGLPGHCLVVIEKRRPTPDRYPRAATERRRAP